MKRPSSIQSVGFTAVTGDYAFRRFSCGNSVRKIARETGSSESAIEEAIRHGQAVLVRAREKRAAAIARIGRFPVVMG